MRDWFFLTASGIQGPFSPEEMKALAESGEIRPDTMIRKSNKEWNRANKYSFLPLVSDSSSSAATDPTDDKNVLHRIRHYFRAQSLAIKFVIVCCPLALVYFCIRAPVLVPYVAASVLVASFLVYGILTCCRDSSVKVFGRILDGALALHVGAIFLLFIGIGFHEDSMRRIQSWQRESELAEQRSLKKLDDDPTIADFKKNNDANNGASLFEKKKTLLLEKVTQTRFLGVYRSILQELEKSDRYTRERGLQEYARQAGTPLEYGRDIMKTRNQIGLTESRIREIETELIILEVEIEKGRMR